MSAPMAIRFDTAPGEGRIDRVTVAVVPIDGFSGAIVTRGITARIEGQMVRPIVNGSGLLVFLNLVDPPDRPDPPTYQVEVDARQAGFFGPERQSFTPPAPGDAQQEEDRKLKFVLKPRPDYPYPAGTTIVRGMVVNGSEAVAAVLVSAMPLNSKDPFAALTDERGAFALALRPSPVDTEMLHGEPLVVDIVIGEGADARKLMAKKVRLGRSQSFAQPIQFPGTNDPDFSTI